MGPFVRFEVRPDGVERTVVDPEAAGVARCAAADLRGGEAEENASRLRAALQGDDTGPHRDALALGAGLALEVCGLATSLAEGVNRARDAMRRGDGTRALDRMGSAP